MKQLNKLIKKFNLSRSIFLILLLLTLYLIYRTFNLSEPFISSDNLDDFLSNDKKQLVLFHADWCGHCIKMKPLWDKIQKERGDDSMMSVHVGKGTDSDKLVMEKYNIKGYPTIIQFNNGEPSHLDGRDEKSIMEFFR